MNRALHWLRARMGVRVVSALAAAVAVAVVLVVAGISLVLLLDHQLRQSTESAAVSQAEVLGQRIAGNFTGSGDAKENSIDATGKRGDIVQVLTDYGDDSDDPDSRVGSNGPQSDVQVIGSSDTLDSQPRMVPWLLAPRETRVVPSTEIRLADGSTEEVTIVGKGVRATGRPITVLAAQPLKPVHQAVDTVSVMVSVGIPILVLITGFFTYLFAGRALRPVEAMRRRVAGLTDRDLDRRVPEPHTQDEVGRLARTMNQMLSRLQDSQATQRRFVADASHELRSPLATVSTGLELLGNGMGKDSADLATVQTLRGETGRLTKLVEGLLFLARADERGLAPRREEVDLDELVEGERVRPSADDSVSVTVSTEPVRVVGDRSQLVRVLRNLVDNARRHAGSTVAVSVRADGDLAVIDVDDDGCGVPEADRTRVFERFVRLDEARARGDGGSGLGLAIVAELVAAHGGTVSAGESERLGGARFRVTVPLSGSPGSLEVAEPTPAAGAGTDEPWTAPDTDRAADVPEHAWAPAALSAAGAATPAVATAEDRNGSDLFSPMVSAGTGDSTTAAPASAGPASVTSASAASASAASGQVTSSTSAWSAFREPEAGSPSTPSDTTAGAGTGSGTDVPAPTAADAGPVLFDDRPSGPLPRVPMGGRRRRPVEATSPTAGKPTAGKPTAGKPTAEDGTAGTSTRSDEVVARPDEASGATPVEAGADTPAVPPANGTPRAPRTTPPPPSTSPTPTPSTQQPSTQQLPVPGPPEPRSPISDPPTGPLPIRPNTVGSPADENATRPLPVVRSAGGGRAGTAVAPARRDAGADGATRNGVTDGATRNGGTNGATRSGTAPNGVTRNGTPPRGLPSRNGGAYGATAPYGRNGAGSNGHGSNGHGLPNGNGFRRPNGRPQDPQDGPGRNGHQTNGHPTNGRARSDRPQNGHPRKGTDGADPRRDDTPES